MTVPRILLSRPMAVGMLCELREEDQRYIKSVLRLKKNDHLVVFDGQGREYHAIIHLIKGDLTIVEILREYRHQNKTCSITLAQGLPKAGKIDFIIQKAVELGVDRIVPFQSARSVSRLTNDRETQKELRRRKIAIEAARQCGRADEPQIDSCVDFADMLAIRQGKGSGIIFWEEETKFGIREALGETRSAAELFLVVGPEGGFLKEEVQQAKQAGFMCVSIGRQILRVETAAVAILAIIQYEKGMLGVAPDSEMRL